MLKDSFKVGDVVHVTSPSKQFLEDVFVDNMMDYGSVGLDKIIAKIREPSRRWRITEIHEGSSGDDPPLASIEGVGFRCEVPSMIEVSSLTLSNDQTTPKNRGVITSPEALAALDNLVFEAKGYLADLSRHHVDATTLIGAIRRAERAIESSKGQQA